MWVCAHDCTTHRDQKTASDPLELELEAIVSDLIWVLKTKLRSS